MSFDTTNLIDMSTRGAVGNMADENSTAKVSHGAWFSTFWSKHHNFGWVVDSIGVDGLVIDQLDNRHRHHVETERRLYRPSSIKLGQFGGTQYEVEFSNTGPTYLGHKHPDEAPTNVAQQSSSSMAPTTTSHGTATRDHLRDAVFCEGLATRSYGLAALLVVLPWLSPPPIIYWSPPTGALNPAKWIHRIISKCKAGHAVVTGKRNTSIRPAEFKPLHKAAKKIPLSAFRDDMLA
ncbi:hypothetical protein HOY82DRAFT_598114 [Tuber indicum]|nr:hypothetical protein HOY82DRAFT_598114 [Tuber indicum]